MSRLCLSRNTEGRNGRAGRRLARHTATALGAIPAGGSATAQVTITPRARAQPLAAPQQNAYQLALTLDCAEVRGLYATLEYDPLPAVEEAVPPAAAAQPEPAPGAAGEESLSLQHGSGYIVAGANVHVGRYSFGEAKLKCAQLLRAHAAAPLTTDKVLGFTFRHAEPQPPETDKMTVYFKARTRAGRSSAWQLYLIDQS
jgi:hypothetical protein